MVLFQVAGVPSRRAGYPLRIIPVPPDFGGANFSDPWTTRRVFPSRLEFFHTFPQTGERAGVRGKDQKGNSYTIGLYPW